MALNKLINVCTASLAPQVCSQVLTLHLIGVLLLLICAGQAHSESRLLAPAQRVVALAPHTVELMYSIGAGERIIATTEFADYPSSAKEIPRVGGYNGLQVERIFELQPDLVLAWDGGNKSEDIDRLEDLGLRVVRSQIASIDDIPEHLTLLGDLLGMQTAAQAVALDYQSELSQMRADHRNKPRVRFFYQLWLEPLKTLTPESWVNESLRSCGGENVFPALAGSAYPQVSIEAVLLKSPQVIIVPSHHGDVVATGEMWQTWPEIPAVANTHIYYIDGDILHRPTLRVLQGMREVCKVFDKVRQGLEKKGQRNAPAKPNNSGAVVSP